MNGISSIAKSLKSALYELQLLFPDKPETLHLGVALVFSSIFRAVDINVVVVGGQAAAYWMRVDGSVDVDFVAQESLKVIDILQEIGFEAETFPFRMVHSNSNVAIELVGEKVRISELDECFENVSIVTTDDINSPFIRDLMHGEALVIDPGLVFLNYASACSLEDEWYDHENEGGQAQARAFTILELYGEYVIEQLNIFRQKKNLSKELWERIASQFQLDF